jgi:hypothetical protein
VGAETEGISMVDVGVFCQRVQFNNNASWTHITNLQMDGDNCVIEHNDSQWTEISNVYFTCGQTGPSNGVPSIQMANGKLSVINISGWPGGLQPLINQGGGWLTVIGGSVYLPAVNNRLLTQSNGSCQISGVRFFPATGAGWTIAPAQCTGGTLSFTNNTVMAYTPASAGFLHINTDDAAHVVVANSWPTGSFTAPGALGTYNNASSLPLAGGSVSGMVTFGSWANFAQAAGTNRGMLFQTGGSMRWDLICNNDGEIGSNNGSNFQLDAYSDSGAFLATPIKVWRTNNVVELANLQVDGFIVGNIKLGTLVNAANDAAAATGGVGVQQVYRNGSVLMYRVS